MKVLVTGGLGFIGSNFCKAISNQHDVTILDSRDLNSGYNRLHETLLKNSCRMIFTKIEDYDNLESLISRFDIVYHFAGQGGHLFAEDNPLVDIDQNIRNTVMILEAISKVPKKPKLIFLSTRQIYGNVTHVPVDETQPADPIDINGISQFACENFIKHYKNKHGLECVILRLTNVYGPGMRTVDARLNFLGFWIGNSIKKIELEVFDPNMLRDFLYVEDLVRLLKKFMFSEGSDLVYNVGSPSGITLQELASCLQTLTGVGIKYSEMPRALNKIKLNKYTSNTALVSSTFNWEPEMSITDGLIKTIEYFFNNKKAYDE